MILEIKSAGRTLVRSRFVSVLAIVAFALGIGITTAVFSIFNGVLLQPLPYPHPDQLVVVYGTQPACSTCPASFPKYYDWKTRNNVFSAMGGSTQASFVMTGNGQPARVSGVFTTASLSDVFGVPPQIGRWYTEAEDQPNGPKVVVLSYELWNSRFAADPAVIGKTVTFDGAPYEIIGVMPRTFSHRRAEFFVPLQRKLDPATRGNHFLATYARLKPDVALQRAINEMRELGTVLAREYNYNHGIDVRSYHESVVGGIRTPLRVLLGAVFLVLLIACANVANLLLASGMARRRELAIRLALGAGSRDLARQLTTESVLLALVGGGIGILLAQWIIYTFVTLAGGQLPRATSVVIDRYVLAFSAVISVLVGVFCGIWPIIMLRTRELASLVREGDTRTGTGAGRRFGNGLVIAEIAVAFTLLVGAGLLVKNLALLLDRDAGIRTERIVSFDVAPSGPRYNDREPLTAFYRDLNSRLSHMDNIESTGMTSHLPMYNFGWNGEFQIEGGNPWGPNEAPLVEYRWIVGDYLKTIGVPLIKGRQLDERDGPNSKTVLINQQMAEKFWPGKDPLGKRFGQDSAQVDQWFEVVGVIGNVRSFGLTRPAPYEFYRTFEQSPFTAGMSVVIRTRASDPTTLIPTVRQVIASIDPAIPITAVQTMEQVVSSSVGQPRLISALTALFAALAALLATVGVYGVMAYNVRRQRREFGIRLALGADKKRMSRLVVTRGFVLALAGVGCGAIGARLLTGVLQTMLDDVKPTDPAIFAGTAAVLLVVALLASYLPARIAARVDPMIVLRDS
jgi:putative ABC transport system permease protein